MTDEISTTNTSSFEIRCAVNSHAFSFLFFRRDILAVAWPTHSHPIRFIVSNVQPALTLKDMDTVATIIASTTGTT